MPRGNMHMMNLNSEPFELIKSGRKTIELRLYDEKRQSVRVGDLIEFSNTDNSGDKLLVKVTALYIYPSFGELYEELPLLSIGYTDENVSSAKPEDMDFYYSRSQQEKYGVVGIRLQLVN